MGSAKSVDVSGQVASSNAIFETLKKIAFGGFQLLPFYPMSRSSDSMGLLLSSLFGLSSLTELNEVIAISRKSPMILVACSH